MRRTNKHHMLPRSKGGEHSGINIKKMPVHKHLDLHAVFSNKTPLEQLKKIVDFNYPIWTDHFRAEICGVLSRYSGGLAYKDEVIRDRKKLKEVL